MTREESIEIIQKLIGRFKSDSRTYKALEMAIQALSQEPTNTWSIKDVADTFKKHGLIREQEPCDDAVSRESVDRILRDMGVNCAYDMPSFWANKGKDYKVIPTKWHKGYQQAVADFDKRIRELPSVTPSITRDIEKSNFSQEQYLLDTDSAYKIGYEQGKSEAQKSGKWIDYSDEGYVECPFCEHATTCEDNIDELHYCFFCGAKMESEE